MKPTKTNDEDACKIAYPLVLKKTTQLCKQYCYSNCTKYQCTLVENHSNTNNNKPLCEWGNASIAWMLEETISEKRLNKSKNHVNSNLRNYISVILSSFELKERWKDWRFRRRIRVPLYIKLLDPDASKVFWWLCDHDTLPNIAQRLNRTENEIEHLIENINKELRIRKKLHILQTTTLVPYLEGSPDESFAGSPQCDIDNNRAFRFVKFERILEKFETLEWNEQYILNAMIIDKLDAQTVKDNLHIDNLTLISDVKPEDITVSQLYYLRNKTLNKLAKISGY